MHKMVYTVVVFLISAAALAAQSTGGLTLDQLLDIGMENNSDIQVAERQLSSARAEHRGAYSGLLPYVRTSLRRDMDPGDVYIDPRTGSSIEPIPYGSSVSVSQTLFDGANSWYNAASGRNALASADAGYIRVRQQTILAIKRVYYTYLSSTELLEVAREAMDNSRRQLELVEERFRLRAVSETDLLKARVSLGERQADVHRAGQSVAEALTNLNVVLGQDPLTPMAIAQDTVTLASLPVREVVFAAVAHINPGLTQQTLAVERAKINAKMQRGVMLPSLSLSYSVNTSGTGMGDLYKETSSGTYLNFSLPLFTGLQNTSRYSRARYATLAEEERLDALERDLKRQAENTLSSLESLHQIYPINRDVLASAEADVRLAEEQYRLGAISILDLLTAQLSLIRARSTLVRTTYDIKIAEAQLETLMGTMDR
ncbi:Outer membrane protein TolC [subsurface metagenome]